MSVPVPARPALEIGSQPYKITSTSAAAPGEVPVKPAVPGEDPTSPSTRRKQTQTVFSGELTRSVERVWLRVFQQAYTVQETAAELGLKRVTCESYLLKAIQSGRSYVWGPHTGVSNEELQKITDAIHDLASQSGGQGGITVDAISRYTEIDDYSRIKLALTHLKQCTELVEENRFQRVVGVRNVGARIRCRRTGGLMVKFGGVKGKRGTGCVVEVNPGFGPGEILRREVPEMESVRAVQSSL